MIVFHTSISNQDAIHNVSILDKSKLASFNGSVYDFSNLVRESLGQNFVKGGDKAYGKEIFDIRITFFLWDQS